MDFKGIKEFCDVCYELFNEASRSPRLILCGHTLCHSCHEEILKNGPRSSCPACKTHINIEKTDLIPINFSIKGLISGAQTRSSSYFQSKLKSEGFCEEHANFKEMRCMDCKSWICDICSTLNHKKCRTLLVKDAYKELRKVFSEKVKSELEYRKTIKDIVIQSLENLQGEREKLKEEIKNKEIALRVCESRIQELQSTKTEDDHICDHLQQLHCSFENSFSEEITEELETLLTDGKFQLSQIDKNGLLKGICREIPSTLEELRKLSESRPVYVVETKDEILYGMVKVCDDQIFIHSFLPGKPIGQYFFPFREFLSRFDRFREFPKTAFLKVIPGGGGIADAVNVVIETNGISPKAKNFTYLCSSLKGQTYKGKTLVFEDSVLYSLASGPPPVVEGIWRSDCKGRWKEGLVAGMREGNSGFNIVLANYIGHSDSKIGLVLSGLVKLKLLKGRILTIKDCGLVI